VRKEAETASSSIKSAWIAVNELLVTAVRKAEQEKLRDELRDDIDKMRREMLDAIKDLKTDIQKSRGSS